MLMSVCLLHPQVDAAHEVDHVSRPQHRQQASHDAAGVGQLPPPRCAGWVYRPQAIGITRPPNARRWPSLRRDLR
eukprot:CAMPEP_0118826584 /NCGR_PEP_ID=MMETSP1162-20130426/12068_1 /TAXON_ID=33656 /ORGANISM="Phaeocystis Sp, Strain CCMP2710" /LENGTH=74 /DNA_ID=CAMNT_0006757329 /DNA_START=496 /DNA_END=716 /DNA_ORIENTATION=+